MHDIKSCASIKTWLKVRLFPKYLHYLRVYLFDGKKVVASKLSYRKINREKNINLENAENCMVLLFQALVNSNADAVMFCAFEWWVCVMFFCGCWMYAPLAFLGCSLYGELRIVWVCSLSVYSNNFLVLSQYLRMLYELDHLLPDIRNLSCLLRLLLPLARDRLYVLGQW